MPNPIYAADERIVGPERSAVPAELLDVNVVAAILACSPRHVYRLADSGKMPTPTKLGALVRWNRQTIMAWIDAGCPAVRTSKIK